MITRNEILETNNMISDMNLDVRTITMGISLLDCADADINKFNEKIYKKITTYAKDLVQVGEELAQKYGKTPAQICLRFCLQSNVLPLPKSSSPERMKQNLDVFDFELSMEDVDRLTTMPETGWSGQHPERF